VRFRHGRPDDLVVTRWGARFLGRRFPCATGRGGIRRRKREGDGATPAGTHGFIGLLYRPDRVARAALPGWARPIGPSDLWSDDPADPDYNHLVRAPHRFGHERLRRPDPLYDIVLLTDWNWPRAVRGQGSAIFVHLWRKPRHPTAGCVAFRRADLLWIVRRLRHRSRLILRR
jgi:L,D-peptidoglycan transpeptidase YkuD (ErfK/YbiS/YcfS/YnhG family)